VAAANAGGATDCARDIRVSSKPGIRMLWLRSGGMETIRCDVEVALNETHQDAVANLEPREYLHLYVSLSDMQSSSPSQ